MSILSLDDLLDEVGFTSAQEASEVPINKTARNDESVFLKLII